LNYKLSLCITTYNRGNILAKCLESIVSQSCFGSEIEIVISDNASTDNTYDIVTKFKDKFPNNIFYYKNEINLGMEKNILKALELGRGKLLRLLNDYTIFNDGALGEF
jgi:abequosyltransferase